MTHQPNKKFVFFCSFYLPNPRPSNQNTVIGLRICKGEEPSAPTLCRISTIFVVRPYESILNGGIKIEVSVVDVAFDMGRKICVKSLCVLTIDGKEISD